MASTFKKDDRVTVAGPEGSAQAGKAGKVLTIAPASEVYPDAVNIPPPRRPDGRQAKPLDGNTVVVTVQIEGEERPRNFFADHLKKGGE